MLNIQNISRQSPILHLSNSTGKSYLECDSSATDVGSVLYQFQNGKQPVVASFSTTMRGAVCCYSSSELELCGLKKSILHFQYLLKYSKITVPMDHSTLKCIYCLKKDCQNSNVS